MAAGDTTAYMKWVEGQVDQTVLSSLPVDFDTDTIKVIVLANTFTPDTTLATTQEHLDDISADEVTTGTAYTGAVTLATTTVTGAGAVVTFDADDVSIGADSGGGFTDARYVVFYKDSGAAATSPLIAVGDLGSDRANTTGSIDLTWSASGILTWTRA
jgi:hypothetical protein